MDKRIFITKICTAGTYSYKRVDEEHAFSTEETAMDYLEENFFDHDADQKSMKLYYSEIDCFDIATGQKVFHKCFNLLGNRIYDEENDFLTKHSEVGKVSLTRFEKGNIVKIKSIKTSTYGLFNDTIGVIAGVPQTKSTDKVYLVDFIGDRGFYDHGHPNEEELELYTDKLPTELIFLKALSEHYQGTKIIPENIFESLFTREVYLLNHRSWNDCEEKSSR